jgi:hypothetical protein
MGFQRAVLRFSGDGAGAVNGRLGRFSIRNSFHSGGAL